MTYAIARRAVLAGLAASALAAPALAASPFRQAGTGAGPDYAVLDGLLAGYVRSPGDGINRVDYRAWKTEAHDTLKQAISVLEAARPSGMARDHQFAYWVNLYNARTIDIVLDHYPVRSIRDIALGGGLFGRGPWKADVLNVEGVALSLDDVEHAILRPVWGDARVHYAVNCASRGCPNLEPRAFRASGLSARLDAAAHAYVNHPRGVSVGEGGVTASRIYDWFATDFGGRNGVERHWRDYAGDPLRQRLDGATSRIRYAYDWALNDA